jgi:hypothetical protein
MCGTGDVSSRTENSGGQFWKRPRCTKDRSARIIIIRRRRRRREKRRIINLPYTTFELLNPCSQNTAKGQNCL